VDKRQPRYAVRHNIRLIRNSRTSFGAAFVPPSPPSFYDFSGDVVITMISVIRFSECGRRPDDLRDALTAVMAASRRQRQPEL